MIHLKRLAMGSIPLIPVIWFVLMLLFPLPVGILTLISVIYLLGYSLLEEKNK